MTLLAATQMSGIDVPLPPFSKLQRASKTRPTRLPAVSSTFLIRKTATSVRPACQCLGLFTEQTDHDLSQCSGVYHDPL